MTLITRFWTDLLGRVGGPLTFRILFQPAFAVVCAVHDGVADARAGRPPYGWALLTQADARRRLLREGCRSVARLLVLGAVMDLVYQLVVLGGLRPMQLVVVVLLLVLVPYLIVRGPATRLARTWFSGRIHTL